MPHKFLRYFARAILVLLGILLLLSVLIYLPPVQNFILRQATRYVDNSLGMELSVGKFRLGFPVDLRLEQAHLLTPERDTLVRFEKLRARAALWPLMAGRAKVNELTLSGVSLNYADTLAAIELKGTLDRLETSGTFGWKSRRVSLGSSSIDGAAVEMEIGVSRKPESDSSSGPWHISASRIDLQTIRFRMRNESPLLDIRADLSEGSIRGAEVDTEKQTVGARAVELTEGVYSYLTDTVAIPPPKEIVDSLPTPTEPSVWDVSVDRVVLTDHSVDYGALYGDPRGGFDPQHLRVTGLNLEATDLHSRGSLLDVTLRSLTGRERSGLVVTEASGGFHTDSTEIRAEGVIVRTPASTVRVTGSIGTAIDRADPGTPVTLDVEASVGTSDLFLFYAPKPSLRHALQGEQVTAEGRIGGSLGNLSLDALRLSMPGHLALSVDGSVGSVTDPDHLRTNLRIEGTLADLDFLRAAIPDTAFRNRIAIPRNMRLTGTVAIAEGTYRPDLTLAVDTGRLRIDGVLNLRSEGYAGRVTADGFPAGSFLPKDSLGAVTLELNAQGRGFDPTADGAASDIDLAVDRFDYKRHTYRAVVIDARLEDHRVDAEVTSRDTSARLDLAVQGEIRPREYSLALSGKIDSVRLQDLGFSASPLTLSMRMDGRAEIAGGAYDLDLTVDSAWYDDGIRRERFAILTLDAKAGPAEVRAELKTGDLDVEFTSASGLDSLLAGFSRTAQVVSAEVEERNLDMERIQQVLPPFTLKAGAGMDNLLAEMLRRRGIGFYRADVTARSSDSGPFDVRMLVDRFQAAGITLDTLNVGMKRQDRALGYYARLANRPGNIEQMALIYLYGNLADSTAQVNFYQRNRTDSVGFRFGVDAVLRDSSVRMTMFPDRPTLGFEQWTVNSGNYVEYRFNKELYADLRLQRGDQHLYLTSESGTDLPPGAVRIDMAGLKIGPTLSLFPSPPAVDGVLNANLLFGLPRNSVIARGTASVADLSYDGQRVGDLGLDLFYLSDPQTGMRVNSAVSLEGTEVLTAKGSYAPSGDGLAVDVALDGFPLEVVGAFVPDDAASLEGTLNGTVTLGGNASQPVLNGGLQFDGAVVTVTAIGEGFTLGSDRIPIENSVIRFEDFTIRAAGDNPLRLNGEADLRDFSNPYVSLNARASDFQAMDVARSAGSMVYGKAFADIDLSARGNLDALRVRGSVRLLSDTDVAYTLPGSDSQIDLQEQEIVTFVSFADTAALARVDSLRPIRTWGMDALVNVDIDENVKVTLNLSDDGENRAGVQGGGSLTFTMNNLGDSRFTGRYELSGGTVYYSPPLMSQKVFNVEEDSYVEWTGEIGNPTLHITAAETVRAQVTTDNTSRYVNFNIVIHLENDLDNLAITFDLQAPQDLTIQNELASMTDEQRGTQAMSLLVYNTYTGPGSTGKVDGSNPLNSFIEKELNQWARNNLNGVDLSFGIDNYDDIGGGSHTDYSYRLSKTLFDDRVTVTIGGKINSDADVEDNLANNFIDDVSIEYRFSKRDNMFLKYYRYTTYESILDGEVIKNGVGYVVRKKMSRLSDLFRFSKNIEKRNRRRERGGRREERREERRRQNLNSPQETPDDEADEGVEAAALAERLGWEEWMAVLEEIRSLRGEDGWIEIIIYEETDENIVENAPEEDR